MGNRHDIALVFAIIMAISCSSRAQDKPQDFVAAHNRIRKELGLPPMRWDKEVAKFANSFAQERKNDCALMHSTTNKYGENVGLGGPDLNATGLVYGWASEKPFYDYATNTCQEGKMCGHYTQVVWKTSVKLGCAKVMCTNTPGCFAICNYEPPGNFIDTKPY